MGSPVGRSYPPPRGGVAVCTRSSTAHCPKAVRQGIAPVPLPTVPKQCGSVLQDLHYPLPPAMRQCVEGDLLPTTPGECGSV